MQGCLTITGLFLIIISCMGLSKLESRQSDSTEVQRLASPDSRIDAVWATRGTGATDGVPALVYVVEHGQKIDDADPVFRARSPVEMHLGWLSNSTLEISASQAQVNESHSDASVRLASGETKTVGILATVGAH